MPGSFNMSTRVSCHNTAAILLLRDFDQIIPMPPHLKRLPDRWLSQERHDWQQEHWGFARTPGFFTFHQASSRVSLRTSDQAPHWIIATLSRQYPDDIFRVSVATDSIGCNCSTYAIRNGTISGKQVLPDYSREAYELAFQNFPLCRYRYVYSAALGTYRGREPAELAHIERMLHELGLI
ncbi:hypothetical protein [Cardiobacterium valvarum]|uniref:Uncharacterized protein n=1 Tax=Cardiobacterium valvarum F0432 TaxID=797473 RepID=G9ZG36_9GAMM|nr:hypothetical protein [Cardiobacterium valvarum]EHM53392.1 hypothetical protein HMPREF9080_01750 [Cardiobacterium valvarum F0432]